jgi:hypothetical protein
MGVNVWIRPRKKQLHGDPSGAAGGIHLEAAERGTG